MNKNIPDESVDWAWLSIKFTTGTIKTTLPFQKGLNRGTNMNAVLLQSIFVLFSIYKEVKKGCSV